MVDRKTKSQLGVDKKTAHGRGEGGFDPHPDKKPSNKSAKPLEKAVGKGPSRR